MRYLLFFILTFITGCVSSYAIPSSMSNSTSCVVDLDSGLYTYSISIMSIFDIEGITDSRIKVSCPSALSFIDVTIEGTQPKPEKKLEHTPIVQDVCCLPF